MTRSRVLTTAVVAIVTVCFAHAQQVPARKSVDELPETKQLPNPFVFRDGSPVKTKQQWERRRAELKALFEGYQYGHLPPKPQKMTVARGQVQVDEAAKITRQDLTLNLEHDGKTLVLHVNLTLPHNGPGTVRVPVIVQGGFGRPPAPRTTRPATSPQAATTRPNRLALFAARGYGAAELNLQEVAIDNKDRARTAGVYPFYGDKIDCGALMAWAWGMHRVIDAIETDDRIDPKKIVVTGHSRYGKAALLAGAFDDRIALTVPSHSGAAGAAPYRFIYAKNEQLHNIVGAFPYWFRPEFNQFVNKVERLPFDQHELIALVAPRALLATEGTQDIWINPQGSQLTHLAAKQVYEFLGAPDRISIRFRPVGHIPSNEDLLDFADHVFFGKPLPDEFGKLAYPQDQNGFTWTAPK
jgi:hypothetical protein